VEDLLKSPPAAPQGSLERQEPQDLVWFTDLHPQDFQKQMRDAYSPDGRGESQGCRMQNREMMKGFWSNER
jgi:hypothetical protein